MTKEQLATELELTRRAIARDTAGLRYELDVLGKLKQSVRNHPLAWLGSASALGYIFAGPKTRTRKVVKFVRDPRLEGKVETKKSGGRLGTLLGLAFTIGKVALPLAKPAITAYAAKRFGDLAQRVAR